MGHSGCGGIHGLMFPEKIAGEPYISRWVSLANPVLAELKAEKPMEDAVLRTRRCEEGAVLLSLENLLSYDWIHDKADAGELSLHALYYDMKAGSLNIWNADIEDFEPSHALFAPRG